jgi:proteasome activator subunit 4
VVSLVLELLADQNLEVRRKAGTVLGGLLHCTFIPPDQRDQLLARFLAASSAKIPKKCREGEDKTAWQLRQSEAVVKRHSGTVGQKSVSRI